MNNPFDRTLIPAGSNLRELGRTPTYKEIDQLFFKLPIQSVLFASPIGTGKTTFIRGYFSDTRRRELAEQQRCLVQPCFFTSSALSSDAGVFQCLIGAVRDCLQNLGPTDPDRLELSNAYEKIAHKEEYRDARQNSANGERLLKELLGTFQDRAYYVVLLLENFHQLTHSDRCALSTFSNMANLDQANLIKYIVVSDYYIGEGSSNYHMSDFRRIFLGSPIQLDGIVKRKPKAALKKLICAQLEQWQEDDDEEEIVSFTEEEMECLWTWTAGIPGLLQRCFASLYQYRKEGGNAISKQELQQLALSACDELMREWTKYFEDLHWKTLDVICKDSREEAVKQQLDKDITPGLKGAGLITSETSTQRWKLICPLFQLYLERELPRHRKPEPAPEPVPPLPYGHTTINNHTTNIYVANNAQSINMISASDFLRQLGIDRGMALPGEAFYRQLHDDFQTSLAGLPATSGILESKQQADQRLDEKIAAYESEVLPDVDPDSLEETDLEDLDRQFVNVRRQMHLENCLSDQFLDSLSPLCRFYLKASIIVENHMSVVMPMLNDYSTQLVMYGKCLEQGLRDTMYPIFHLFPEFRNYNTHKQIDTLGKAETFAEMKETKMMLGTFSTMIHKNKGKLARLCAEYRVIVPGVVDHPYQYAKWEDWWSAFAKKVDKVRIIRNMIHAGDPSPSKNDLDEMRKGIFGEDGVLYLSQVGRVLSYRKANPSNRVLAAREARQFIEEGKVWEMSQCKLQKRALEGILNLPIEGCTVIGHMKNSLARNYYPDLEAINGETVPITIRSFDAQNNYFVVEPVARARKFKSL